MPITDQKKAQFHPTMRNRVLASADVRLQQVQLVDKKGQIRSVIVWQCGTDMFYANNMDGLFDVAQRKAAPEWLKDAMIELPSEALFNYDGTSKSGSSSQVTQEKEHLPSDDNDMPDFVQG